MTPRALDEPLLAAQCKALGDPVRLRILGLLPKSPDCRYRSNVSQLSEALGLTQPTVSHHLKILKHAGLIECQKKCRDVFYWINEENANAMLEQMGLAFDIGSVDPRVHEPLPH